jgi:hypothetical protein
VTTPWATSGPSAPDVSVVNPVQSSAPEKRHTGLIVLMIFLSLVLIGIIGWLFLVNGEYLCLDRRPWWGPPENPDVYTSCSGHLDELLHK